MNTELQNFLCFSLGLCSPFYSQISTRLKDHKSVCAEISQAGGIYIQCIQTGESRSVGTGYGGGRWETGPVHH